MNSKREDELKDQKPARHIGTDSIEKERIGDQEPDNGHLVPVGRMPKKVAAKWCLEQSVHVVDSLRIP